MPALLLPPRTFCHQCISSPKRSPSPATSRDESIPLSPAFSIPDSYPSPMVSFSDLKCSPGASQPKRNVQPATALPEKLPSFLGPVSSFLYQHACQTQHEETPEFPRPGTKVDLNQDSSARRERYAQKCPPRLTEYNPPNNFGTVLDGRVFRSAFPKPENFAFLRSLGIKSILTLVPGPYEDEYVEFMDAEGIRHINVQIPPNKGSVSVDAVDMIKALEVAMNPDNFPLLIHCNKGKHRTGCVVGALRKCQGWSIEDIIGEYHVYATAKARLWDEVFLKFFDERKAVSTFVQECLDGIIPQAILADPQKNPAQLIEAGIRDAN